MIYRLLFLLALTGAAALPAWAQRPVFIANQGNFSDQNGSVTVVESNGTPRDFIQAQTVIQSVHLLIPRLYVMANTSNWVDVYDFETGEQTGRIEGVFSPRYMVTDFGRFGYVTNLYKEDAGFTGGTVTVIDLMDEQVKTVIEVGDNPEGLVLRGSRLYVANHGFGAGTTVSVIDTGTETVVDTIDTGCDGPRFVFLDGQAELLIFCTGKTVWNDDFTEILERTNGQIVFWNLAADSAATRIVLPRQLGTTGPGQDAFFEPGDQQAFTVMEDRVLRIHTELNAITDTLLVPGADPVGAVAYLAPHTLLLGRVPDFTSRGHVTRLGLDGTDLGTWEAGIAPSYIVVPLPGTLPAVEAGSELPRSLLSLDSTYPNPFRETTTVRFTLREPAAVTLTVHAPDGRTVATVERETLGSGTHERTWTAGDLAAGAYLIRLRAGDVVATRPLLLIR